MATPNIAAPSAVLQFPSEVNPEVITQDKLTHYKALRQRIEALEAESEQMEAEIRASLEAGAAVEPGIFRALLKTTERRSVSWKAVCERELGEAYCARVLGSTKPDKITRLVVEA